MMTTTARPSGPPVSICSRKLMNSTLNRFSSSSTPRKCLTDRAIPVGCPDQHDFEPVATGIAHHLVQSGTLDPGAADPVRILLDDLVAALLGHLAEVMQLGLGMLIESGDRHIEGGALHREVLFRYRYYI